ncbi:MAG: 3'-5' exonuclease, partial [Chitinophagales bacterium]
SFDEIINLGVDYLNLYPGKSPFSYVIADEIQDFSNIELRLLRNLAPEGKNDLFLVGDPLQKIYNKQLNFSKSGINIRGRRSRRLKVNYRTTEEIRKLAMTTIQNIDFDDFDGEAESKKGYISLMHGQLPLYKLFDTSKEEKEYLLELVQQLVISKEISAKLDFREICLCARTNKTINDFKTVLHKASLPYYNLKDKTGEKSGIRLSTFHNIKGLEFKAVIMVGVQEGQVPLKPYQYNNWSKLEKKYHNKRERALLYVAMTRAIQGLYISGVGERSSLLSVEEDKAK